MSTPTGTPITFALAAIAAGSLAQPASAQSGAAGADPGVRTVIQPEARPGAQPGGQVGDDIVTISQVAEPVELRTLVELAQAWLGINVSMEPGVSGAVVFTQPVSVPRDKLLDLIASLLEQQGYAIFQDDLTGFYNVVSADNLPLAFEGALATSRIIQTPNIRPSTLKPAIEDHVGADTVRVTYIDDLGMLVVSGTPSQIRLVERLVDRIIAERGELVRTRIELDVVNAPVARRRLLELVGALEIDRLNQGLQGAGQPNRGVQDRQQNQQPQGQAGAQVVFGSLDNLEERLFVAPGNALLFRGRPDEVEEIRELVALIDVMPDLVERRYFTGTQTEAIARQASVRQLGDMIIMGLDDNQPGIGNIQGQGDVQNLGVQSEGGSRIVADIYQQTIVYYGTEAQQEIMAGIVDSFEPEQDLIVVQPYKLYHANAVDLADIINGLISNQQQGGDAPLLPGGGGNVQGRGQPNTPQPIQPEGAGGGEGEGIGWRGGDVFVIADEANNQLLVKAPQRQQIEFQKLIERLDLRRPQVFLDVKIVAVTWTDDLELGVELQGVSGDYAFNTNYGLSTFPEGGNFLDPKQVALGLAGLTAAIVQTDQVPIIINAVQNTADGRIISSPKLLVDDNEESSIKSLEEIPYQQISQGQVSDQIALGGYEQAGTELTVTPSISEGGNVRLAYEIKLSSFVGTGSDGLPPPQLSREVASEAVTVPADMTIVIGGIEVDDVTKTRVRVPLLGDIPLIGLLFGTEGKNQRRASLYVFITPRVLRDPTPVDYRLLTKGPQATVDIEDTIPKLEPIVIPIVEPERTASTSDAGGGS